MEAGWDLVADMGGTNLRIARATPGGLDAARVGAAYGAEGVVSALAAFAQGQGAPPRRVAVAVAGPIRDGWAEVTNNGQRIEAAAASAALGGADVRLLNDFEAAAWAHAAPEFSQLVTLQGPPEGRPGPRLVLGPGTGLGVGGLFPAPGGKAILATEGGHVGLSPSTAEEAPVFAALAALWPEARIAPMTVEAEAMLSGLGLPLLHTACAQVLGTDATGLSAAEVIAAGRRGEDPAAALTLKIFRRRLGALAGDLALAYAAAGGVFIVGGVTARNPWILDESFLAAFNAGGRFGAYRQSLPIYLNTDDLACLRGAAAALTLS